MAAATASIAHMRGGRINWRLFAWMAPPSVLGAVVGGLFSGLIPDDILLAFIGLTLLYFGIDLLRPSPQDGPTGTGGELNLRAGVISGALIGVLGGRVGLILGALRMPTLLRYVGEEPARAVGTNLTVGLCVGIRRSSDRPAKSKEGRRAAGPLPSRGRDARDWSQVAAPLARRCCRAVTSSSGFG